VEFEGAREMHEVVNHAILVGVWRVVYPSVVDVLWLLLNIHNYDFVDRLG